tara:strand:+ start:9540 stop:9935 length:396 start_codon:yes stop_codon:yes gene_type:complete
MRTSIRRRRGLDAQGLAHGPHTRLHGLHVEAVSLCPIQVLAGERVVQGGKLAGAQERLLSVDATKRRVVIRETRTRRRRAQVALGAWHAPLRVHPEVHTRGIVIRVGGAFGDQELRGRQGETKRAVTGKGA